jgi:hypothetical protein
MSPYHLADSSQLVPRNLRGCLDFEHASRIASNSISANFLFLQRAMSGNQTPLKSSAHSIYAASHISGFSNGISLDESNWLTTYFG